MAATPAPDPEPPGARLTPAPCEIIGAAPEPQPFPEPDPEPTPPSSSSLEPQSLDSNPIEAEANWREPLTYQVFEPREVTTARRASRTMLPSRFERPKGGFRVVATIISLGVLVGAGTASLIVAADGRGERAATAPPAEPAIAPPHPPPVAAPPPPLAAPPPAPAASPPEPVAIASDPPLPPSSASSAPNVAPAKLKLPHAPHKARAKPTSSSGGTPADGVSSPPPSRAQTDLDRMFGGRK